MRSLVNSVNSQKALARYAYCLTNARPAKIFSRNEMRLASFSLYLVVNMFLSLIQQFTHKCGGGVRVDEVGYFGYCDFAILGTIIAPRASIKTVRADEHVLSGRVIYPAAGYTALPARTTKRPIFISLRAILWRWSVVAF